MEPEAVLEAVYTDPRQAGSFTSADKLKRAVKKLKKFQVSIKTVKNWLKGKDTYTKHRVSRKNFPRNKIISPYIDAQWQGDLAEVGNLASHNDEIKFLLILIDIVSKQLWVEPLESKHGSVVLAALKRIFDRAGRKPDKLQTDDGKEFVDKKVQKYLKEQSIEFFTVKSDKKAAIAERVIRTLKEKIYRYMHEKHTKRYLDVLQDLVASYNDTYHRSIKMAPSEVSHKNEGEILEQLYGEAWQKDRIDAEKKFKKKTLKEGDFVRISRVKGVFTKGYIGNWTEEIFIVAKVEKRHPFVMYRLNDWSGEGIQGVFYEKEVQLVSKELEGFWKVEKVLKSRKVGRKTQYFVKWEGYPDSVNSWVEEKDIKHLTAGSNASQ